MYEWKIIGWQCRDDVVAAAEKRYEGRAAATVLLRAIEIRPLADGQRFLEYLVEHAETKHAAQHALSLHLGEKTTAQFSTEQSTGFFSFA